MAKKILDTSVLLHHWSRSGGNSPADRTVDEAKGWGKELAGLHDTDAIVTPVYLEMVVGVVSAHQLDLMRAFLGHFRIIDNGNLTPEDWKEAAVSASACPVTATGGNLATVSFAPSQTVCGTM
jgi:hypothetical protein